jgi:probable F420-dependent oxidoreductase
MKVAISLAMMRPSMWADAAILADHVGFESAWIPEHLVFPVASKGSPHDGAEHPPVPASIPTFDVFSYISYLAAKTEHLHFGTQVYNIGLRHPFITARAAMTTDVLSNGRLELGIGASWLREEWEANGLHFDTRGKRVDEAIAICQKLWTEDTIEFHGEHFDFDPVMFEPKPMQIGGPPLHIGGDGKAALRRAATVGKGWIPMNHAPAQLWDPICDIAERRAAIGRDEVCEITLAWGDGALESLVELAEAGVHRAIVKPFASGKEAMEKIEAYAPILAEAASIPTREP